MKSWCEHPITRPITLPYFKPTILSLGILWCSFTTLLSIVTVGYESYDFRSAVFNLTRELWYERVIPDTPLLPHRPHCEGSIIKVSEGNI